MQCDRIIYVIKPSYTPLLLDKCCAAHPRPKGGGKQHLKERQPKLRIERFSVSAI